MTLGTLEIIETAEQLKDSENFEHLACDLCYAEGYVGKMVALCGDVLEFDIMWGVHPGPTDDVCEACIETPRCLSCGKKFLPYFRG